MTIRKSKSASAPQHEENPAWLVREPEGGNIVSPVETRPDKLPFLERGWENFERLCRRLAATSSQVEVAWAYGRRGQKQYGIDILVRTKDGGYEVWQTKRYEKLGPSDVQKAIDIFLGHPWAEKAQRLVLVFACPFDSTSVVEAIEEARDRLTSRRIEFRPLDRIGLTEALILQPEIIDDFFGRAWVRQVCPPEAIGRLERRLLLDRKDVGWGTPTTFSSGVEVASQNVDAVLRAQNQKLDALSEGQTRLATKSDLAALVKALETDSGHLAVRLPQVIADRLLREEFAKALKRRGFKLADTPGELADLANRALDGDLMSGSSALRAEICERAARANAAPDTRDIAMRFRDHVATLDASCDLLVVDALLKEAAGDTDAALRDLRVRDDVDARSALFNVLIRQRGTEAAIEWARAESLRAVDFTAPSAMNLVIKMIENCEFETALAFITDIPPEYFEEVAALCLLRAQLRLASILPLDQKSALFEGLPINPRQLDVASGPNADATAKAALVDLRGLAAQLNNLDLDYLADFLDEFMLWLRLEIGDERAAAREQLAREIANPKTTLRRVRLALSYDVPFDKEALARSLASRKQVGGWNPDERFAALLIALHEGEALTICQFFTEHHDDLFVQSDLALSYLAAIEIQALARAGRIEDARRAIELHRGRHVTEDQAREAEGRLAAIEKGDEIEQHRQRYDESGNLAELRMLVAGLRARRDTKLLARYAPALARATHRREDFDVAIRALYSADQDRDVVDLANELAELTALDPEYESIKGWSLYREGSVTEARTVARKLLRVRNEGSDRELAINTAIETGDWGDLQKIVAQESERIDALSAGDAMRLARLAHECGSAYVERFRDSALAKAPDDPNVYLSAYMLATERGEEYRGTEAQEWFAKAVALSGPHGPVQALSFRDAVNHISGWGNRSDQFETALRRAEMPVFVIARALRRHLLDMTLGQACRNLDACDRRLSFPVLAYSGAKAVLKPDAKSTAALDITALITLHYLGKLDQALAFFERIVIAPRTLSFLFAERQFIRVQQPSEVAKARRIQALISAGRLKVIHRSADSAIGKEIGHDLVTLLDAARTNGGLVVRSAPIPKLGSYLEEDADVSAYAQQLTDTLEVLSFLAARGKLDIAKRQAAERYLLQVDKRWDAAPSIQEASLLYLDDLAVTYLDHVGLLDVLAQSVQAIFVHLDVAEQTQAILRHAEHADELLNSIEQIRSAIATAIASGRVTFCRRHVSREPTGAEDEDPLGTSPTLDLLADLAGVHVGIADDRFLNKLPFWTDAAGRTARSASSLDVLGALYASGRINSEAHWIARHKLRRAGFYAVPLDADELLYHLLHASVRNGAIVETPELAAIRESLALPLIYDAFLATESHWLAGVRFSICKSIRQTWNDVAEERLARARADWLLSILPDPMAWCQEPGSDTSWAAARQQTAIQAAILMVFAEGSRTRRRRYSRWLDAKLTGPLRHHYPEIWDAALEFLKSYLEKLWGIDDERT